MMMWLLLVNAAIGVVHKYKADGAIEMLKTKLKVTVKALRDGSWVDVAAEDIVPDDIVPANGVILKFKPFTPETKRSGALVQI